MLKMMNILISCLKKFNQILISSNNIRIKNFQLRVSITKIREELIIHQKVYKISCIKPLRIKLPTENS